MQPRSGGLFGSPSQTDSGAGRRSSVVVSICYDTYNMMSAFECAAMPWWLEPRLNTSLYLAM